jgi:acetylornithine aminotransferase
MIGIQLNQESAPIISELRSNGLLTLPAGPDVIRLLPPLTVTADEIDEAIAIIEKTIKHTALTVSQ